MRIAYVLQEPFYDSAHEDRISFGEFEILVSQYIVYKLAKP